MPYKCTNIYECPTASKLEKSQGVPHKSICKLCHYKEESIPSALYSDFMQACPVCGRLSGMRDTNIKLAELLSGTAKGYCLLCGCSCIAIQELEDNDPDKLNFIVEFIKELLEHKDEEELGMALHDISHSGIYGTFEEFRSRVEFFVINIIEDPAKQERLYERIRKCEKYTSEKFLPVL